MNLYSREAAVLYLESHDRKTSEEAVAEYFDWLDGWLDTFVDYEAPVIPVGPCLQYQRKEETT